MTAVTSSVGFCDDDDDDDGDDDDDYIDSQMLIPMYHTMVSSEERSRHSVFADLACSVSNIHHSAHDGPH